MMLRGALNQQLQFLFFLIALSYLWTLVICAELVGGNICTRLETYEEPQLVVESRPYEVRETTWCLKIPPRCTKIKTRYRDEIVTRMTTKSKVVRKCCDGYEQSDDNHCRPKCNDSCGQHGRCVAPDVCKCDPGFHGALCNQGYETILKTFPDFPWSTSVIPNITFPASNGKNHSSTNNHISHMISTNVPPGMSINVPPSMSTNVPPSMSTNEPRSTTTNVSSVIETAIPTAIYKEKIENSTEYSILHNNISTLEFPLKSPSIHITTNITLSNPITNSDFKATADFPLIPSNSSSPEYSPKNIHNRSFENNTTDTKSSFSSGDFKTPDLFLFSTAASPSQATTNVTNQQLVSNEFYNEPVKTTTQQNESSTINETTSKKYSTKFITTANPEISKVTTNDNKSHHFAVVVSNNETLENNFHFLHLDLAPTLIIIIGGSMVTVLILLITVLLCHRKHKTAPLKNNQKEVKSEETLEKEVLPNIPNIIHSQLPPTPTESFTVEACKMPSNTSLYTNSEGNVFIVKQITMATTNTLPALRNSFKPEPDQTTILPALREVFESHYDHPPPSVFSTLKRERSNINKENLTSNQRSPSLAALWNAVMSPTESQEKEEHLYDEIPYCNPAIHRQVSSYDNYYKQTSQC